MKKIGTGIVIVGLIITIIGFILKYMENKAVSAISIIGGSDGPTSVFLAGKVGNQSVVIEILVGIAIIIVGAIIIRKK